MSLESLFRSLKAQPQEPAHPIAAATRLAAPATSQNSVPAADPVIARVGATDADETRVSRWPIFQSHALTTWQESAPLSEQEKKSRLELPELLDRLDPPNDQLTSPDGTDIKLALRKLNDYMLSNPPPPMASAHIEPGHESSLVSLFNRLRGGPAQAEAPALRRRSFASNRMNGR